MAIKLCEHGEEVIYRTKRLEEGVECDICGKFIKASRKHSNNDNKKYFKVMTGHRDWGNDSCDSIDYKDICPECITKFVSEYLSQNKYETAYINIETEYTYPVFHWS